MKTTRKGFFKYLNEYVPFIDYMRTTDGTYFLSICGYDGGDVYESGLEDMDNVGTVGILFTETNLIDQFIAEAAEEFGEKKPKMTFTEYCNQ